MQFSSAKNLNDSENNISLPKRAPSAALSKAALSPSFPNNEMFQGPIGFFYLQNHLLLDLPGLYIFGFLTDFSRDLINFIAISLRFENNPGRAILKFFFCN